ncbi:hypothetical protein O3P69_016717 [Scylla paramamosain]|uniref:Uncharacterized protein n=1 Tax=Scylla paramamosain TaxID=85552 RepID=A0AAW0SYR6_SCYPA
MAPEKTPLDSSGSSMQRQSIPNLKYNLADISSRGPVYSHHYHTGPAAWLPPEVTRCCAMARFSPCRGSPGSSTMRIRQNLLIASSSTHVME